MMKKYLGWVLLLMQAVVVAQPVSVGIYRQELVNKVVVYCSEGAYALDMDGISTFHLKEGEILYLSLGEEQIKVLDSRKDYGSAGLVELRALTGSASFRIRPIEPELESRVFDDDLVVKPGKRFLDLLNLVDMDKYIAGVVEAEAGLNAPAEFYKAQAILCRTYAMESMDRHEGEGFSLCDQVHCQAYKGKSSINSGILEAVMETTHLVAADYNYKLITAAYHSNSGGQTQRSSDVWLQDADYLQAVVDPYSLRQPHAKWADTISFEEWKDYLLENGMEAVERIPKEIIYVEQMRRKKYFILDGDSLRMTKIREDWGFRSTYFDMFPEGDSILVWGKGYGHGIGMSQEGAMKMAGDGFSHEDILHFYFHQIRIMDYRDLPASSLSMQRSDR